MSHRSVNQVTFNPKDLAVNAVTFASSFNSNPFGVSGFNQITLHYEVTRVAATDLSFYLSALPDGGSSYGRHRFGDVDPSTGIATYRLHQYLIPDIATAASQSGTLYIPINMEGNMKIEAIVGTAATTDTLLLWVTLGNV